jgi:hypothetical protein
MKQLQSHQIAYTQNEHKVKNHYMSVTATQQHLNKIRKNFLYQNLFHLSPVSLTTVINLYFRIFQRIFVKIRNGPRGILRGRGILIYEKSLKSKFSCQNPINDTPTSLTYGPQYLTPSA